MCFRRRSTEPRPDMSYIRATWRRQAHLKAGSDLARKHYFSGHRRRRGAAARGARPLPGHRFHRLLPEREDPGNKEFSTRNIPKLVGGVTPACAEVGMAAYEGAIDRLVLVSSTKVAELAKLLENIQRSVNIGLVNEMKIIADRMGIDIHDVVDAAATSRRFPLVSWQGMGGHVPPPDTFYMTWKAESASAPALELPGDQSGDAGMGVSQDRRALNVVPVPSRQRFSRSHRYKKNSTTCRRIAAVLSWSCSAARAEWTIPIPTSGPRDGDHHSIQRGPLTPTTSQAMMRVV